MQNRLKARCGWDSSCVLQVCMHHTDICTHKAWERNGLTLHRPSNPSTPSVSLTPNVSPLNLWSLCRHHTWLGIAPGWFLLWGQGVSNAFLRQHSSSLADWCTILSLGHMPTKPNSTESFQSPVLSFQAPPSGVALPKTVSELGCSPHVGRMHFITPVMSPCALYLAIFIRNGTSLLF